MEKSPASVGRLVLRELRLERSRHFEGFGQVSVLKAEHGWAFEVETAGVVAVREGKAYLVPWHLVTPCQVEVVAPLELKVAGGKR